jgi:hypothetical protein
MLVDEVKSMTREERTEAARALVIKLGKGVAALKADGMTDAQMKKSCQEMVPKMAMYLRMFAQAAAARAAVAGAGEVQDAMAEFQEAFPSDKEWEELLGVETGRAVVDMFREAIRKASGK